MCCDEVLLPASERYTSQATFGDDVLSLIMVKKLAAEYMRWRDYGLSNLYFYNYFDNIS